MIYFLLFQPEKERRLKEKNAANTKKFMDERKNNMLNQNKKREKQKKTHAKELENIHKYIEDVRSMIFWIFCGSGYSRVSSHKTLSYTDLVDTIL